MGKIEIGIDNIQDIYLRVEGDKLQIDDESNDGVIKCSIKNLKDTIRIIERAYKNHNNLSYHVYGSGHNTVQLSAYQQSIGVYVFYSNYIVVSHMPNIIKMLKSVKVEKEKCILDKDRLFDLGINDLVNLKQTMRRRKKVLTDENGYKYIEV